MLHSKNGIYEEMFVAAIISATFVLKDVYEVVEVGLSAVSRKSRLAEAIRETIDWRRESKDYWETYRKIVNKHSFKTQCTR